MTTNTSTTYPFGSNKGGFTFAAAIELPIEAGAPVTLKPLQPDLYIYDMPTLLEDFKARSRQKAALVEEAKATNNPFNTSRFECAQTADDRMIDVLQHGLNGQWKLFVTDEKIEGSKPLGFAYTTKNLRDHYANVFNHAAHDLEQAIAKRSELLTPAWTSKRETAVRNLEVALAARSAGNQYLQAPVALEVHPKDSLSDLKKDGRIEVLGSIALNNKGYTYK